MPKKIDIKICFRSKAWVFPFAENCKILLVTSDKRRTRKLKHKRNCFHFCNEIFVVVILEEKSFKDLKKKKFKFRPKVFVSLKKIISIRDSVQYFFLHLEERKKIAIQVSSIDCTFPEYFKMKRENLFFSQTRESSIKKCDVKHFFSQHFLFNPFLFAYD